MWCGQHPAEGCCLQPAGECGWFLQYQLKTGALPSPCEPRGRLWAQSQCLMLCAIPCTHTHTFTPLSEPFPTYWSGLKRIFFFFCFLMHACLSSRPPLGGQASLCYQPQRWWLLSELPPSLLPKAAATKALAQAQHSCSPRPGSSCAERMPRIPARLQGKDINAGWGGGGEQQRYNKKS